ncbi:MAG: hypothetical protein IJV62_02250, partial [Eggerthellaceae bacterium]|nr:hypothetical protein [Eggerthellaceae bacterium]
MSQRPDIRLMIVAVFIYSLSLFFITTRSGMAVAAVIGLLFVYIICPPYKRIMQAFIPMLARLVLIGITHVYYHGVMVAVLYLVRIVLLSLVTFAMSFSYDANSFSNAFQGFLKIFRPFHIPVDDISSAAALALRFIPVTLSEFQRIQASFFARG